MKYFSPQKEINEKSIELNKLACLNKVNELKPESKLDLYNYYS